MSAAEERKRTDKQESSTTRESQRNMLSNAFQKAESLMNNAELRNKFGLKSQRPLFFLHDICVQDVRLICEEPILEEIRFSGANGCRSAVVDLEDVVDCRIAVTCADEELADDCQSVIVRVEVFVLLVDEESNPVCGCQLNNIEIECEQFFRFPTGELVEGVDLERELQIIDGSCIVINLECDWDPDTATATISGTIIDKLWKHENLWIAAFAPHRGMITVKQLFNDDHQIPRCNNET